MRDLHSEKGLKTLDLMGTKPDDWGLTPIKWVLEDILHPIEMECPTCRGRGRQHIYPDGTLYTEQHARKALKLKKDDWAYHKIDEWKKKHKVEYGRCPTCPQKRARNFGLIEVGTGVVVKWVKAKVWVGYPQWAKGTLFDSRFHDGLYQDNRIGNVRYVCELCSKSITGRWSLTVPVNARSKDGKVHGMYVGEDCARKFLGLELVLDDKQLEGIKKSERRQHFKISMTSHK